MRGILLKMCYKSLRIIDGKPRWVIIDEHDNIIDKNPTKERLKCLIVDNKRKKKVLKDRKCCKCGNTDTYIDKNGNPTWLRYLDKNKVWDEESFVCSRCNTHLWKHGYLSEEEIIEKKSEYIKMKRKKYFEGRTCCTCGGSNTWMRGDTPYWYVHKCEKENCSGYICGSCQCKSRSALRNEKFYLYDDRIKWLLGECVVCKTIGVKNRNFGEDNFRSYSDTYRHPVYGEIDVKTLSLIEGRWKASFGGSEFDTAVILCMDKNWKSIERMYIIYYDYIDGRTGITFYKNTRFLISKWEKFRVKEEESNNNYQNLLLYLKDREPFSLEDLKCWMGKL